MKLFRISIIRAIAALVVGVLLLKYDSAVLKGLTIALGVMFLIAGVVSLVGWVNTRRKSVDFRVYDNGEESGAAESTQPMFPIAGLGSLLLGLILALTRSDDYLEWAMYLVGGVLVLAALNMLMNLNAARKMEPVAGWMWIVPLLIVVASVLAMLKGLVPAATCTMILGITALVYAVFELVYSFVFSGIRKRYEKTQTQVRHASQVSTAPAEEGLVVSEE
ncbi:MAG: DUF308 domain-containing protein [Prevotella sp.]|nr:DUF308 domain-containing protein [Prevotella sp.]